MLNLLSEEQLAEQLGGINVRTLQRWRYKGIGPAWTKVGRTPMYRLEDVQRWLESNVVESVANATPNGEESE